VPFFILDKRAPAHPSIVSEVYQDFSTDDLYPLKSSDINVIAGGFSLER
jgi:hypothetical protein